MPRIGILTGVRTELEALAPISGAVGAPLTKLSGARPSRAYKGVQELIDLGVEGILSFGSAGAISPHLQPGQLILGETVLAPDGKITPTDPVWTTTIADALGIDPVGIVGLSEIAGMETKTQIYAETGRAALDMESHIIAEKAGEAGIPFAVLRAVVDPANFEFPGFVLDSVRPDGSISFLPIIAGLCIQPWMIGRLLDLNRYNSAAMQALSGASRTLGPGFGFLSR